MISLIDVIFLLLIFALVKTSIESSGSAGADPFQTMEIAFAPVQHGTDANRLKVTVISPHLVNNRLETVYFLDDDFAGSDGMGFAGLPASRAIAEQIDRYRIFKDTASGEDFLRLRPRADTPFKVVDFVLRKCSVMGQEIVLVVSDSTGGGV